MGHARKRPEHIEKATRGGNFDLLSAAGVKSGQVRRENAIKKEQEEIAEKARLTEQELHEAEMLALRRDQDEAKRRRETNEHIYPPETYD